MAPKSSADWDVTEPRATFREVEFDVSEGTWMSLDVSRDGRTIVFDLLGDIYAMEIGGGDAILIHGGPAIETRPRFSPDGTCLAYVSDRGGSDELWVSRLDGSEARQVTNESPSTVGAPSWHPDGRSLVATRFEPARTKLMSAQIHVYDLVSGHGELVVEAPSNGKAVHEPEISRDGRFLYFTENVSPPGGMAHNPLRPSYAITRRDLRTGRQEEVVGGFGSATTGRLSPEGRRLSFVRRIGARTALFVLDLDTGEQRPIVDDLDRDLHAHWNPRAASYYPQYAWLPDGDEIVIWSGGHLRRIHVGSRASADIPFRAECRHRLVDPPRFETELARDSFIARALTCPAVSPDRSLVVFGALGSLWMRRLPTGASERLTSAGSFEFDATFSPDGSRLAVVTWDDAEGGSIHLIDLGNDRSVTLVHGRGIVRQPKFSADGRRVTFWVEPGNPTTGGYRNRPGIYWVASTGGDPVFVHGEGRQPQFAPDGERIVFVTDGSGSGDSSGGECLRSIALEGGEPVVHVRGPRITEIVPSPDLTWFAYKQDLQYRVAPLAATETTSVVGDDEPGSHQISDRGGSSIAWAPDSTAVHWFLGNVLFTQSLASLDGAADETVIDVEVQVPRPPGTIALTGARIITMNDDEVIEDGVVVVEGDRIVDLGDVADVDVPATATVIDATGTTIVPGFVDMHGHIDFGEDGRLFPQKHRGHYASLAFGVTTDFDPSATDVESFVRAEMNRAGISVGPRLISTGQPLYGIAKPGWYTPVIDFEEARRHIAGRVARGAIAVKSYLFPARRQRQQLVEAAREAGVMIAPEGEGHLLNNLSMVLDGHTTIEHNLPVASLYDDYIQLLAASKTALTPTLVVHNGEADAETYYYEVSQPWLDHRVRSFNPPVMGGDPVHVRGMISLHQVSELWDIGYRSTARWIARLDRAGVVINAGGHGQLVGFSFHWEMWALAEGGMPPLRVLRTGTINGAKTLGLDAQIGSIEVGKLADLVVLAGDPRDDIRHTADIRFTMVGGRLFDVVTMEEVGRPSVPRGPFHWETADSGDIVWNPAWGGNSAHLPAGATSSNSSCCPCH